MLVKHNECGLTVISTTKNLIFDNHRTRAVLIKIIKVIKVIKEHRVFHFTASFVISCLVLYHFKTIKSTLL